MYSYFSVMFLTITLENLYETRIALLTQKSQGLVLKCLMSACIIYSFHFEKFHEHFYRTPEMKYIQSIHLVYNLEPQKTDKFILSYFPIHPKIYIMQVQVIRINFSYWLYRIFSCVTVTKIYFDKNVIKMHLECLH